MTSVQGSEKGRGEVAILLAHARQALVTVSSGLQDQAVAVCGV